MADQAKKEAEGAVITEQFKRNLDHILIGSAGGPEITIGDTVLTFRKKAPVTALAILVGEENRVEGMKGYIRKALLKGQEEAFEELLDDVDIDGLGEILAALGEGYTSFPAQS